MRAKKNNFRPFLYNSLQKWRQNSVTISQLQQDIATETNFLCSHSAMLLPNLSGYVVTCHDLG